MKINVTQVSGHNRFEITNEKGLKSKMGACDEFSDVQYGLRPMEMLASSLAGCVAIDLLNILKKKRLEVKHFAVEIDAVRSEGIPGSFTKIHLDLHVGGVKAALVNKFTGLVLEKYCSVALSLNPNIEITHSVHENK